MRTSLNEIKAIEDHIYGYNTTPDALLFEARLILDSNLRNDFNLQQEAYRAVQQYGRKQLKEEIAAVHQQLLQQRQGFMQRMMNLFLR